MTRTTTQVVFEFVDPNAARWFAHDMREQGWVSEIHVVTSDRDEAPANRQIAFAVRETTEAVSS